jgi:LexA-binding, inner membrane-associated putative hydrolase
MGRQHEISYTYPCECFNGNLDDRHHRAKFPRQRPCRRLTVRQYDRMTSTLFRIFFGVDMTLGLFNYVACSWLAGQHFSVLFLFLSIFSTHLPDVDMIPYLLFRKRYRLVSHWVFAHHPLILLPLVAIASFVTAKIWMPDRAGYTVALITAGVLVHLMHDGMDALGFPWFSPFSKAQFRFRRWKFGIVRQVEIDKWRNDWQSRERSAKDEISDRAPPITQAHLIFWGASIIVLIVFFIERN